MIKFILPACSLIISLMMAIPNYAAPFKVAAIEYNPYFLQFETNLPGLLSATEQAAQQGAKLIVLPEMATTGYIYKDRAQINPFLDTIPGKTTKALEAITKKYHVYVAVGVAERDAVTHLAYNAAALIGPNGYIGKYRKNQLNSADTRWATRGNLGYPVFDTELGKIALLICYDDVYLQSLEIPALRGANVIAYLTSSDRLLLDEPNAKYNHSTIANIASIAGWVGTYIVASNRTDTESNPATGLVTHYSGAASIWDPTGKNLAQAPVSSPRNPMPPVTLYAQIDPSFYDNSAKSILSYVRRPELYQDLSLYRAPFDPDASTASHMVNAVLLQYTPVIGDKQANFKIIQSLLQQAASKKFNLVVLPQNSLVGVLAGSAMKNQSESLSGDSIQKIISLSRLYNTHIIFSFPEKNNNQFFSTAALIDNKGKLIGVYRKTHLNVSDKSWATAGNEIPVFNTSLGRIGIILDDEVRVPDLAAVMAVKRADIIAIPSNWAGDYGGPVLVDPQLLVKPFPPNTMFMWYNVAKYAQAYTLVANFVGGAPQYRGSSGLYSLDPIQGNYPPIIASANQEAIFNVTFYTLGSSDWWINQANLIVGRRAELAAPLLLTMTTSCFMDWQQKSTGNNFCWDH